MRTILTAEAAVFGTLHLFCILLNFMRNSNLQGIKFICRTHYTDIHL